MGVFQDKALGDITQVRCLCSFLPVRQWILAPEMDVFNVCVFRDGAHWYWTTKVVTLKELLWFFWFSVRNVLSHMICWLLHDDAATFADARWLARSCVTRVTELVERATRRHGVSFRICHMPLFFVPWCVTSMRPSENNSPRLWPAALFASRRPPLSLFIARLARPSLSVIEPQGDFSKNKKIQIQSKLKNELRWYQRGATQLGRLLRLSTKCSVCVTSWGGGRLEFCDLSTRFLLKAEKEFIFFENKLRPTEGFLCVNCVKFR